MGFVVDEKANQLIAFNPLDFVKTLSVGDKQAFLEICRKGTISSILEVYLFMRRKRCNGKVMEVCPGFIENYRKTLSIPLHDSRRIQQELSTFAIARTAFNPSDERPYIPGSAIKGALRTAYLNSCAAAQQISTPGGKSPARDLEAKLLDAYTIETDPFRLLKVSDFRPVGEVRTGIFYAINQKKKPSKFEARGPHQILEVIESGSLFEGTISVAEPEDGAHIKKPLTLEAVIMSARSFYSQEMARECEDLAGIGVNFSCSTKVDNGFILRLGRHSGAECVTIEGHRTIKIMQARGEPPRFEKHATTLWLAADFPKPLSNTGLKPFGWGAVDILSPEMMVECNTKEQNYQLKQRAPARKQFGAEDGSVEESMKSEAEKLPSGSSSLEKAAAREVWPEAILSWSPGNQILTASFGGKKAICKGKALVPEVFHERLFGKKKVVTAKVEVIPLGNSFNIIRVEADK
jgi:CRISPR-associated protein Csm5